MVRIAVVTPVYPPYRGGMGVVAKREAEALRKRTAIVDVFSPDTVKPIWRNGHASIIPQLFWKLRDYDVVYLHYPFYGAEIFAALAALIWRKPLVVRYHMRATVRGWRYIVFWIHRVLIEPFVLMIARAIIVSSHDYARAIGLNASQVSEYPFGVNVDDFCLSDSQALNIACDVSFLFVGGMDRPHYFKGVPELLKACATLPERGWHLILVGDGELRQSYEALAKTYGIDSRVTFTGSIPHEELVEHFQQADVHVLPSINQSEAFGLVTLEAGSCGCASIVSDLPGVRTLVEEDKTGYIVKPGHVGDLSSALIRCLKDPQRVHAMGEAARLRTEERYDERRIMDRLYTLFSELV